MSLIKSTFPPIFPRPSPPLAQTDTLIDRLRVSKNASLPEKPPLNFDDLTGGDTLMDVLSNVRGADTLNLEDYPKLSEVETNLLVMLYESTQIDDTPEDPLEKKA